MGTRVTRFAESIYKMSTDIVKPVIERKDSKFGRLHVKARCEMYPRSQLKRFPVVDKDVRWEVDYSDYNPLVYTSEGVLKGPVWADPDLINVNADIQWNALDSDVSRISHMGQYKIGADGLPRNPVGRTGIKGRGCLGRWGPNHAADPIVTRWKRDEDDQLVKGDNDKYVLQFVAVQRRDNDQWAIPGGMVDPGEVITETLKREFGEEAMNSMKMSPQAKLKTEKEISELFSHGKEVYRGYVDDPRNTDNSWMETIALNFHDEEGTGVSRIKLHAGDDAIGVRWMDLTSKLEIYASHIDFLQEVAQRLDASW